MKYCKKCGKEIGDQDLWCTYCGERQEEPVPMTVQAGGDEPSVGMAVIAFLFPLIGFIMWAVLVGSSPKRASSVGAAAIVGVMITFVLSFVLFDNLLGDVMRLLF